MNNKKVFSFHMFAQTLKQTRLAGFIMMVIMMLVSVVPIVSSISFLKEYNEVANVNGISDNYALVLIFILVTPVMSFIIWNFLNRRSSSDFYHSIPYTRLCIYLSKTAAILTWIIGILAASYIAQTVLYTANRKYFNVDYGVMTRMYLAMFLCSFLCMAIINVAASITGNILSNICVTGLIMFLPRFIAVMITEMTVYHGETYMFRGSGVGLLDASNNMIVGMIFEVLGINNGSRGLSEMVLGLSSNMYTLVLALIYAALGALLFIKRKSETAGKAANGKVLPMIIRTLICFSVAFTGVMMAYTNETDDVIIGVVVLFIVSALLVFVYECIVSKKMAVVKQCVPAILLGYVLAVVVGTGADSFGKYEAAYEPAASKLSYVTIKSDDVYDGDYFNTMTSRVHFTDEDIVKYVSEKFVAYKDKCNAAGVHNYTHSSTQTYTTYRIGFRQNGVTHYRRVYLSASDVDKLAGLLKKDENYVKAYMDLPESSKVSVDFPRGEMQDSDYKAIYETLVNEVKEMGFEKWYAATNSEDYTFSMIVNFSRNGVNYSMTVPISKNVPKTYKKYIDARNSYAVKNKGSELDRVSEILDKYLNDESRISKILSDSKESLSLVVVSDDAREYIDLDSYIRSDKDKAQDVIKKLSESVKSRSFNKEINPDNPVIVINYENYNDDLSVYGGQNAVHYGRTIYSSADAIIQLDGYTGMSDYITGFSNY